MEKIVANCATGTVTVVPLTAQDIAYLEYVGKISRTLAASEAKAALARSADLAIVRNGSSDPNYEAAVARLLGAS